MKANPVLRLGALALGSALSLGFFAPAAFAGELAGVRLADTATVGGKTLKLNGLGLRKKAIFKVYVGGLYLEAPSKDAAAILAADAPRRMVMHFLRGVEKAKLVEAFAEGFEANAKDKVAGLKADIEKLYAALGDVKDGDEWVFTYTPGAGTVVTAGGKDSAAIGSKEFADALFSLWLGPKPPTEDLKKGLLGG